jgi:hypothetical protein
MQLMKGFFYLFPDKAFFRNMKKRKRVNSLKNPIETSKIIIWETK